MITLFALALALVALVLIVAGWVLAHRPQPQPRFARIVNGANTPDGLKAHRR